MSEGEVSPVWIIRLTLLIYSCRTLPSSLHCRAVVGLLYNWFALRMRLIISILQTCHQNYRIYSSKLCYAHEIERREESIKYSAVYRNWIPRKTCVLHSRTSSNVSINLKFALSFIVYVVVTRSAILKRYLRYVMPTKKRMFNNENELPLATVEILNNNKTRTCRFL